MCYLARQQQAEPERGAAGAPTGLGRLRPRVIAAVGAALIGGLALAAFTASPSSPISSVKEPAAPVPLVSKASQIPPATVVEQVSTGLDDGVPTATDVAKAGSGHCHHGM